MQLPPGWEVKKSRSTGQIYYANEVLQTAQFEFPPGTRKVPASSLGLSTTDQTRQRLEEEARAEKLAKQKLEEEAKAEKAAKEWEATREEREAKAKADESAGSRRKIDVAKKKRRIG